MALALALGERHLGLTWPNPSVGAVVVDSRSVILAQGTTQPGGRPHAERAALEAAGAAARGATLYVSLEPCSHHGKSPPCVDAVIASGIARVVSALEDPDRRVAGRGHALLRQAGIQVDIGCRAEEARRAHIGHIIRVTEGRPAIDLKLARTTEGFAGSRFGRLMISGEAATARVHLMRAHADAIMVGVGTVLADDPLLDVRLPGLEERSPIRIIVDSSLRTPPSARVADTVRVPTWIIATTAASIDAEKALVARGVKVMRVDPAVGGGHVDLRQALHLLASRGITRVFCEGGPELANALAKEDLIDELTLMTGRSARGEGDILALGPDLQERMESLRLIGEEQIGQDLFMFWERG